jgi:hypothetical protein
MIENRSDVAERLIGSLKAAPILWLPADNGGTDNGDTGNG